MLHFGTMNDAAGNIEVRAATVEDAPDIAAILAEAFPSLYQGIFGRLNVAESAALLTALYRGGSLSLESTHVAVQSGRIVGLAILHLGSDIGRGTPAQYWRTLRRQMHPARSLRAFGGGLATNWFLNRRIPRASDLVYIEALAVGADSRGQGIGTRLLDFAAAWTRASGRTRLALHVLERNTGARRLYERAGFRLWERDGLDRALASRPGRKRPSEYAALLMQRWLD